MPLQINKFESREALIVSLTADVLEALSSVIGERSVSSMLLAGGNTPGPLYEHLSKQHFPWDRVWVAPTDERWVAPTHEDSNEKLIRGTLIKNEASKIQYMSLKSKADNPVRGQIEIENKLKELPWPPEVVLLGMGEDGHVASLFPGLPDTRDAMSIENTQRCHPVRREGDDVARISITLNTLLNSKRIFLLCYGEKKLKVIEKSAKEKTELFPVSHLLCQDAVPVTLYWAK